MANSTNKIWNITYAFERISRAEKRHIILPRAIWTAIYQLNKPGRVQ